MDIEFQLRQKGASTCDCDILLDAANEIARLRAEVERLRERKAPATRQLLNLTKALLDDANADNKQLMEIAAEIARLRAREAEARTLILSASLFMPSYPSAEGRLDWIRSSQKWLDAPARER